MTTPFTYSNYSTLRQCGRKFQYSVIEKLPQPSAVALEFGTALHAGLNEALTSGNSESSIDMFQAFWQASIPKLDFSEERYKAAEMETVGIKFCAGFLKRYGSKMKLIVGEQRFKGNYGEEIEGTPDALVEWEGKNVLLDFKSSAYNYDPLKTDISLQLNLYAWLLEENGYKVDSVCYFVFNKASGSIQTPVQSPYNKEKALQMIGEAVAYWKREQGYFERNPNACVIGKQICPYASRCWK